MFKKEQFGVVFNTIFAIVFSIALTLFVKFMNGQLTFESFAMGFVNSFGINFALGTFIPLLKIGNGFAGIFVKNEKSILFYCLRLFAIVLIMAALMCILVMFTEMGFTMTLIFAFVGSFPMVFLFAYIVGLVTFPFVFKSTMALCSKN